MSFVGILSKFINFPFQREWESKRSPLTDKVQTSHIPTSSAYHISTSASNTSESTSLTYYRSNINPVEFTPPSQPASICYGNHTPQFEAGYGVLSASAFSETCKPIGSNSTFQALLQQDFESSYPVPTYSSIHTNQTDGGDQVCSTTESMEYLRNSSSALSYGNYAGLDVSSSSHISSPTSQSHLSKGNKLGLKPLPPSFPQYPPLPPLIQSPLPVVTISSLTPSKFSHCFSEKPKLNSMSATAADMMSYRNTVRSFQR